MTAAIRAEAAACRADLAVFDSSSLGKVLVRGRGAGRGLDWLCTADIQTAELGQAGHPAGGHLLNMTGSTVHDQNCKYWDVFLKTTFFQNDFNNHLSYILLQ